uniref:Trichohyalin isoform X2 n=1 Tax=Drosophila rhopaloa TaxID=1041015 RepID=A0A6P4FJ98_DRORH
MLLLVIWLLCSASPFFLEAYPVVDSQERSALPAHLSDPADYPDLTNGLTDAEVQESLEDLTLDDLNSLNKLLDEHISQDENVDSDASLRTQSRQAKDLKQKQDYQSLDVALDDGCRDEDDLDETKSNQCTKRPNCQSTKRCPKKTTCAPKTTQKCITKPANDNCKSKSGGYMEDDLISDTTKCPKPKNKKCKKPKDDLECDADDFLCHAMKRDRKKEDKNNLQEDEDPDSEEYVPGKELAGIEQLGEEAIPALNDQGEPLDDALNFDFPKAPKQEVKLEQPSQLEQQSNFELENQANSEQNRKSKLVREANLVLENRAQLDQEHQSNLEKENQINLEQQHSNIKKSCEANLRDLKLDNHKNVMQEPQEHLRHEYKEVDNNDNLEQENVVKLKQEDQVNFYQDYQPSFEQEQQANFELRNQVSLEQENQPNFKQERQAALDLVNQPNFKKENQANMELDNQYNFEQEQKLNLEQENQETLDHGNQGEQQVYRDQKVSATNIERAKQAECEPLAEQPAPLDSNERQQLSMIDQRKRKQAEAENKMEEQMNNEDEKKQTLMKDEPLNADLAQQEPLFDSDSFIANNARDPPRYLIQMQNDCIQSENDRGERRLREDRSQSEALNLEKLAEEEEGSPMEDLNLESEFKRSKRENKETDDAPEKHI